MNIKPASLAVILSLALACGMAGCAPASDDAPAQDAATSFREEKIDLPDEAYQVLDLRVTDAGQLFVATGDRESGRVSVLALGDDGVLTETFNTDDLRKTLDAELSYGRACLTSQGQLVCGYRTASGEDEAFYLVDGDSFSVLPLAVPAEAFGLRWAEDGTVLAVGNTSVSCMDAVRGDELSSVALPGDTYVSDAAAREGTVYVSTTTSSGALVKAELAAFDAATGEPQALEPALQEGLEQALPAANATGGGCSAMLASSEDGLFLCAGGSVFRCASDGVECLLDGVGTHLESASDHPERLLVDTDGDLYVLYRHNDGAALHTLYRYVEGERPDVEKKLVVYALEDNSLVRQAVATFRDGHPDVAVEMEVGIPDGSGTSADDALRALNADLLAGTGPDVLVLDGLPIDQLGEQGMLRDLSDQVNAATAGEAYCENVLRAFETDAGCFAVPLRFSIPAIVGDANALAHADTLDGLVSCLDADDETRALLSSSVSLQALYCASSGVIAGEAGEVDADALATFYDGTRRLLEMAEGNLPEQADPAYDYVEDRFARLGDGTDSLGSAVYFLLFDDTRIAIGPIEGETDFAYAGLTMEHAGLPCVYKPLSFDGSLVFQPRAIVGVSANSDVAATAETFVAYLLERTQQLQGQDSGLPVCVAAFEGRTRLANGGYAVSAGTAPGSSDAVEFNRGPFTAEEIQSCIDLMQSVDTACTDDKVVADAVMAGLRAYCRDEATLEQAVDTAVQKINLYRAQ